MSKSEMIVRVRGSGCKMLNTLPLETMTRAQVVAHLKASCCPVYARLVKEFGEEYVCGSINERPTS